MDIGSGRGYPESALSNFAPHPFTLDEVPIASMEGFLQSLKFPQPEMQKYVCTLVGRAAKAKGRGKDWQRTGKLHWQGKEIDRYAKEYQDLLDRAFWTLYSTNESAKKALLASQDAVLEHSIGKRKESDTVLTRSEFCGRLTRIRELLKVKEAQCHPQP